MSTQHVDMQRLHEATNKEASSLCDLESLFDAGTSGPASGKLRTHHLVTDLLSPRSEAMSSIHGTAATFDPNGRCPAIDDIPSNLTIVFQDSRAPGPYTCSSPVPSQETYKNGPLSSKRVCDRQLLDAFSSSN
ncbi:hypothetical protein AJ80_03497 [Polytolypa hystricis UAMH7299]|uniref:Uncharacterized protein n=1 Tax=Polytolypa hystricis (strain UAMH7299) TaxID=1447883 RepID=A0A2B7YJD2_POLH7|nr:hypothetical protein AJ80_03497 [Polytolypa hystricis UAMH7299]